MTESFAKLFEESMQTTEIRLGFIVKGVVVAICKDTVLVDAGLKSESAISIDQFYNQKGELEVSIGDQIDVTLDTVENGFGETILSREKAKRHEAWLSLDKSYKEDIKVIGIINGKVKGGFTVEINSIRAFLPGSLVDIRPIKDTGYLEGKELEFKVIKLDKKRNNVVVSRKAVIESENNVERNILLASLQEGIKISGIIKNLTDYGAFVDLGGIDGLLHITDMSWKRIKHPNEIVSIGDTIEVKILKFDRERTRVSLGLKQLSTDPWMFISKRYPINTIVNGKVTNLTDYGCFVEIEEGIEGLVHVSEMDWTNKNIHPSKVVHISKIVQVMVLDIDENRRRISLGVKQCKTNPWKKFDKTFNKGDCIEGKIKSITDFGIFLGLPGNIDGLVHLSDISWDISGEKAIKKYKKGDLISAIVLQVDSDRERISLGIKQIKEDPFNKYINIHKKGSIVIGLITYIKNKMIIIELSDGICGHLLIDKKVKITDYYKKNIKIGNFISLIILNYDHKNRKVNLFINFKHKINNKINVKNKIKK
ncbi:MAG: 30S ribosomal protein S1 [Enterobacterales bacterium]